MPQQGMSIHVVDVTRSRAAVGMRVDVYVVGHERQLIASGMAGPRGLVEDERLAGLLSVGPYEAHFHVADYFRSVGISLPPRPFLDVVHYRFGIADSGRHYHLPFKTSPWGFSCFLGA